MTRVKRKEFAPTGKGLCLQESKQEVTKFVSLVKNDSN